MTRAGGMGPWLADIAANVLAITVLVLIAMARLTGGTPTPAREEALTPRLVVPIGGAAAVELLRQRLLPGAQGYLDIAGDINPPPGDVAAVFILDPALYPVAIAKLGDRSPDWHELTVPEALKTRDNGWDPGFLALAKVAEDPARFRAELQALLVRNGQTGSAAATGATGESRLKWWFQAATDIMGFLVLALAAWGIRRLHRWTVRA